jgi:HK97 family phage prohead protease
VITREVPFQASLLGPRQVKVRASTEDLGRDNLIVVAQGIDIGPYYRNPVVLWQHQPETPVARATRLAIANSTLDADIDFAPEGVSPKADEVCGLVKSGIVSGLSLGFEPIDAEPLEAGKRRGPQRVVRCELLEISFVSIPAVREAVVTQRAKRLRASSWYLIGAGTSTDLGHRLLAAQGLQGRAARVTVANALRFGADARPAFGGRGLCRPHDPRDREAALWQHQAAVTEASLARRPAVPLSLLERRRELAELRGF